MCGRYYIDIDAEELRDIANEAEKRSGQAPGLEAAKTSGEIFPSDIVPVRTGPDEYRFMKWGFQGRDGRLVINARSETAMQKPMFQGSMRERRCLIPASGYYEWMKFAGQKIKLKFYLGGGIIFLAGCYRQNDEKGIDDFVILTREAADSVSFVHDRMPVIIPRSHAGTWFVDGPEAIKHSLDDIEFDNA